MIEPTAADLRASGKSDRAVPRSRPHLTTEWIIFAALILALMPLGLLGLNATISAAQTADRERIGLYRIGNAQMARILAGELAADRAQVSRVLANVPIERLFPEEARRICSGFQISLGPTAQISPAVYIVYPGGARSLCNVRSPSYLGSEDIPAPQSRALVIDSKREQLISTVQFAGRTQPFAAVLVYSANALLKLSTRDSEMNGIDLSLVAGDRELLLEGGLGRVVPPSMLKISHPIGQTGIAMTLSAPRVAFTQTTLIAILAPLGMWAGAAIFSWLLLSVLIMRPLSRLHRSVAAYHPGAVFVRPLKRRAIAKEIVQLENDFGALSETVADDKLALAKALQQQTSLTREVHHRVKNNLQIIASLINLHSRSAPTKEATEAFRTIQRRVDALAVVHRNHYADVEEHNGIALRPLISELGASLRGGIDSGGVVTPMSVSIVPVHVSQDVAVPIAFLITEIAELSMNCSPTAPVEIVVAQSSEQAGRKIATLSIGSSGLIDCMTKTEMMTGRYERVLTGLSRQLRQQLITDADGSGYSIEIAVLDQAGDAQ